MKAPTPDKKPGKGKRRPGSKWPLVLLVICLIIISFLLALLIRYWTRGPKGIGTTPGSNTSTEGATTIPLSNETVHTDTEVSTEEVITRTSEADTTGNASSSSEETSESTTPPPDDSTIPTPPQDPTIPKKFPPGPNTYHGDTLRVGPKPGKYSINITLNGNTTESTMVSGVVDVRLQPETATKQVVLTADPETIKEFSLALFEDVETPTGVAITAVTPITGKNFFVVELGEEIVNGKTYRLVMAYEYSAPPSGFSPFMSPSEGFVRMELQPLQAHIAFPCFEYDILVTVELTVTVPDSLRVVANAPTVGQPSGSGSYTIYRFEETIAMPLHKLAWVAFPTSFQAEDCGQSWFRHLLEPDASTATTWFGSIGSKFMCSFYIQDVHEEFVAVKPYLESCMKPVGKPGHEVGEMLTLRMVYLVIGNKAFRVALQKFIKDNIFSKAKTNDQITAFASDLPKETIEPWMDFHFNTVKIERQQSTVTVTWPSK